MDSFFSASVGHSSHFARLVRSATFLSMCVSRKKRKERNAPPPRAGIERAFHSAAQSTTSPRVPVPRRRCRRRSRSRDSLRRAADEAVYEAPGSRAQRERAERRCNGGGNQEKIFRLSASRFARRFFCLFSEPFLSLVPHFFFFSQLSLDSLLRQAGSLTPLPPPSRLFPRSPSHSHGVKRAKPSLCCRFPHSADKAQGRTRCFRN